MTSESYNWQVNLVKERFHYLKLTFEQAEQLFAFEKEDENLTITNNSLSEWEEMDYQSYILRSILNDNQLTIFNQKKEEEIHNYKLRLIEEDKNQSNEVEFYKEKVKYFEEQFFPDFLNERLVKSLHLLSDEVAKINFLKEEYKRFLQSLKIRILISHFRNYRTYKPNELDVALLKHRLKVLWPDYSSFKQEMDEPTISAARYVIQKYKHLPDMYDNLILSKLQSIEKFNTIQSDGYKGVNRYGWHTIITGQPNAEEEKENRLMSLLLLDQNTYNC